MAKDKANSADQATTMVVTLTEFNDRWNKMALGISDRDVPSRPDGTRPQAGGDDAGRGPNRVVRDPR